MKVNKVVEYLNDESIAVRDRFKVLTGFDSQVGQKIQSNDFWFNALFAAGIITRIEKSKGVSGFFAYALGTDLKTQLKDAYKKAIGDFDDEDDEDYDLDQAKGEYIVLVANYLSKQQEHAEIASFEFADPKELIKLSVAPAPVI